jgi:hypothetical protein
MVEEILVWFIMIWAIGFVIHCPIFKPWFGFRKPKGHKGHWFE